MFLGKSRENKEGKNTLSWQFGTVLIKCLKKSGQINDRRKIIEKHTVTKRIVLEVKNGKSSTIYVSIHIYMCVYICLSSYLTSEWTSNACCVENIIMTYILWGRWYSDMEKSQLLNYGEYCIKDRKLYNEGCQRQQPVGL